jgi:hypothetical protein
MTISSSLPSSSSSSEPTSPLLPSHPPHRHRHPTHQQSYWMQHKPLQRHHHRIDYQNPR